MQSPVVYSTFDSRTLSKTSRKQVLFFCRNQNRTDIFIIQDHRYHHPNTDLNYNNVDQYQFLTTSATKNSNVPQSENLVYFSPLKPQETYYLLKKNSDLIIGAEFKRNPQITFIACYCSNNTSDEKLVDDLYPDLKRVTESVLPHNFLVISGDFKGKDKAPLTYNKEVKRNGE